MKQKAFSDISDIRHLNCFHSAESIEMALAIGIYSREVN